MSVREQIEEAMLRIDGEPWTEQAASMRVLVAYLTNELEIAKATIAALEGKA